jgi:hypothetical protein
MYRFVAASRDAAESLTAVLRTREFVCDPAQPSPSGWHVLATATAPRARWHLVRLAQRVHGCRFDTSLPGR